MVHYQIYNFVYYYIILFYNCYLQVSYFAPVGPAELQSLEEPQKRVEPLEQVGVATPGYVVK